MQHKHKWLSNNASFTLNTHEVCWGYTSHESWCVGKIDVQDVQVTCTCVITVPTTKEVPQVQCTIPTTLQPLILAI